MSTLQKNDSTIRKLEESELDQQTPFILEQFKHKKIKKVLLVVPPDTMEEEGLFNNDYAKKRRYSNLPPYGLGVLAAHLKNIGVEASITNLRHLIFKTAYKLNDEKPFKYTEIWQERLLHDISEFKPEMIGISCLFSLTHNSLISVSRFVKENYNVPLAIGGVHVSNSQEKIIADIPDADFIFLKESDLSFPDFIEFINRKKGVSDLSQLIIRKNNEYLEVPNCKIPTSADFDIIPDYSLLELAELSKVGRIGNFNYLLPEKTRIATCLSSKGCRGQCTFCSVRNFNGKGVRARSISNIVNELEILEKEYGINHIMWLDDDLLYDSKRAIALFKAMKKRGLNLTWDASNGVVAASCTEDVISAAVESGCIGLQLGIETGSERILKKMRKPGNRKIFQRAADVLQKYEKIYSCAFLILGFPGETYSDIVDTYQLGIDMNLDWYRFTILELFPNTDLFNDMISGTDMNNGRKNIRYNMGPFAKKHDTNKTFVDFLCTRPLNEIPKQNELSEIQFILDYKLNYEPIFQEKRPQKQNLLKKHLSDITNFIAPDNAFALFFLICYVLQKTLLTLAYAIDYRKY